MDQINYYRSLDLKNTNVVTNVISMDEIFKKCILFIGAGGSMTREMATLGLPTISIYQSNLLNVDEYLISKCFMIHLINPTVQEVKDYVQGFPLRNNRELMNLGERSYELIDATVKEYIM